MNIDPVINMTMTVLNGSMLLCLLIVITLGRRKMRRARASKGVVMLMSDPRQCLLGFERLGMTRAKSLTLPALTEEDHL